MRTLTIFCLLSFTSLAFGQKVEKMDRHAAAQAWAAISFPLPQDTPSVSGGGLVIERGLNGDAGRKVWSAFTQPGSYLLRGKTCSGEETKLGELGWETNQNNQVNSNLIYDGATPSPTFPLMSQICSVDAIRIDKGKIEGSSVVDVNPWQQPATPGFQFGSESVTKDGRYSVATTPLPVDAVVIIGRNAVATEIQRSPTSSVAILPAGANLPPIGPATITVCSKGKCGTITFERKMEVPTSGSGKG